MPSDSELRRRFREGTRPRDQIDVDAVLRRVRARRRPRVLLAGAGSVLAIAAIAVPAVITSTGAGGSQTTSLVAGSEYAPEAAPDAGGAADSDAALSRAPAEKLNLCTAPLADPAPAENGLVIAAQPVTAAATDRDIPVTVTLTNDGTTDILGTTGSRPALTLSSDGITLWHTNGPGDLMARIVDLGPGESMTYETTFEPVVCDVVDDTQESFRADLPAAGPGSFLLSAAIDVSHDDGSAIDLVTGPPVVITLG